MQVLSKTIILVSIFFCAMALHAQPNNDRDKNKSNRDSLTNRAVNTMQKRINLTDKQKEQVLLIEKQQHQLMDSLNNQKLTIEQRRVQIEKINRLYRQQMQNTFTSEQQQKYRELNRQRMDSVHQRLDKQKIRYREVNKNLN